MSVERLIGPVEETETNTTDSQSAEAYKSVIGELLESGVRPGKELFEALNARFVDSRRAPIREPMSPKSKDEENSS